MCSLYLLCGVPNEFFKIPKEALIIFDIQVGTVRLRKVVRSQAGI